MRLIPALVAVGILAGSASAADLKVPKQYGTIQAAVDAAAEGDSITVSKGTYVENVVVGKRGIRLVGKKAVLDGTVGTTDGVCLTVTADDVSVQGFTFRNGTGHILATGNGLAVAQCAFVDPEANAVDVLGDGASVASCTFRGAGDRAVVATGAGARIEKNTVHQSDNVGIAVAGDGAVIAGNRVDTTEDGVGIRVDGNGAIVQKNTVTGADGGGILVTGGQALLDANTVRWTRNGPGIQADGAAAVVSGNRIQGASGGIAATGDGVRVLSNVVDHTLGGSGIRVLGDGLTVSLNSVKVVVGGPAGIEARSGTAAGAGLVEGNRVEAAGSTGFLLSGIFNATIRGNSAERCGSRDDEGFLVEGDGNVLEDDEATGCDNTGFRVVGAGNTATRCASVDCRGNGFRVEGADNLFRDCSAKGSGDGFDNGGTATAVEGGVFRGNRLDVANRVGAGATLTLTGVDYASGGDATEPQID